MDRETVWQADAVALADRISALLTIVWSAEAEIGTLLAEIESRGVMELFGYRSVARLFEHLADVPKSAAETVVKRARALTPSRALDGSPIPAVAAATGAAAAEGRLSSPMIDTIVGVMTQIPPEHRDDAEQHLLTFASEAGHKQVAALGARILAHLDPDGAAPDETEPATPSRELSLRRKRTGFWELNGRFDDETGARASALLDTLAERHSTDEGPDLRSPLERYGDAFSDAIDLAYNSPDLPMHAGERAHVMVAVSLADLKSGIGQAMLGDTATTSAAGLSAFGNTGTAAKSAAGQAAPSNTGTPAQAGTGLAAFDDTGTIPTPVAGRGGLGTMPGAGVGRATLGNTGTTTPAVGLAALDTMPKPGVGRALLGDTGTISAAEARIHACDCKLIPAVLGTQSGELPPVVRTPDLR
jgi:uncharacterized protein DUF222